MDLAAWFNTANCLAFFVRLHLPLKINLTLFSGPYILEHPRAPLSFTYFLSSLFLSKVEDGDNNMPDEVDRVLSY